MKVTLITYTPHPEQTIASAARLCYSAASIDDLREKMTEAFEKRFGPEGFPSELAKSMQLSCHDPDISAGDRRLLYALALSTAVHKGVPNADNLVKRDYLAAAVVETKGENPLAK